MLSFEKWDELHSSYVGLFLEKTVKNAFSIWQKRLGDAPGRRTHLGRQAQIAKVYLAHPDRQACIR